MVPRKNWKQRGEVATLFTIATLILMGIGTFLGAQKAIQQNVLKVASFAYDHTFKGHFYTGPSFDDKGNYLLIRGSLCFTGTTIPSQPGRFWVHTPRDPNRGYPQKACDNTNADPKDDCIVYEGKTVEYIASQVSRPYCDSPDVGKKNWRAWDFTLKLNKPFSQDLCQGLFVTSSSSFVFRDPIEMDMNAWHKLLGENGIDCAPTQVPSPTGGQQPSIPPSVTPSPTLPPGATVTPRPKPGCLKGCDPIANPCKTGYTCKQAPCPIGQLCIQILQCIPDDPANPECPMLSPTPTPVLGRCGKPCGPFLPVCGSGLKCVGPTQGPTIIVGQPGTCRPVDPHIICPRPVITLQPIPTDTPTPTGGPSPTNNPLQAKIRGSIIVHSCVQPDKVQTKLCEKNNSSNCEVSDIDVKLPPTQDPLNPNLWTYTYEHTLAPSRIVPNKEPIERGVLYENMQAWAVYNKNGIISLPGTITYPPIQTTPPRSIAYAYINLNENEYQIDYDVPQDPLVCPAPTATGQPVTPTSQPPTAQPPTATPTPGICTYSATTEVFDEATGKAIPVSQLGNSSKWGLANDKQIQKPRILFSNYGDVVGGEKTTRYTFQTDHLTFRPDDPAALYTKGEKAQVNLFIDTNKWQITRKAPCQGDGCPNPNEPVASHALDQYGDTTTGFVFDCNTLVSYRWYVKRIAAPQCVIRDGENAGLCTPKNVEFVKLKSTSTVSVRWDRPSDACDFRVGVNGDHYKMDIIDMTEDSSKVITSCDNLPATRADCTLSATYHPNSSGSRGTFQRGHNYHVNVYAVKTIPGASDICASINGQTDFTRASKDTNPVPTDNPEPTTGPVGPGGALTKQLDWLLGESGVCWAGWSHGDCRHDYNGTDQWAKSVTDGRFDCLAPRLAHTATVRLRNSAAESSVTLSPKRVDCAQCSPAQQGAVSQCPSGPNSSTTNGSSITLNKGECYQVDENLGISKLASCPTTDAGQISSQPAPRNPGQPQPTAGSSTPAPSGIPLRITTHHFTNKTGGSIQYVLMAARLNKSDGSIIDLQSKHYSIEINSANRKPNGSYIDQKNELILDPNFSYEIAARDINGNSLDIGSSELVRSFVPPCVVRIASRNPGHIQEDCIVKNPTELKVKLQDYAAVGFNLYDEGYTGQTTPTTSGIPLRISVRHYTSLMSGSLQYELGYIKYDKITGLPDAPVIKKHNIPLNSSTRQLDGSYQDSKDDFIIDPNFAYVVGASIINNNKEPIGESTLPSVNMPGCKMIDSHTIFSRGGKDHQDCIIQDIKALEIASIGSAYISFNLFDEGHPPAAPSDTVSITLALNNQSSSSIKSLNIASCDSNNQCSTNFMSVSLASGASTKIKPNFSIRSNTRRLSCVVTYSNGTVKQCTPQLVTQNSGSLQFNISTAADGSVRTTVLSPLKNADTNGDCVITSVDRVGLRDLDGNGQVNAADSSLFLSLLGQNACK